jgi:undecaprenyl-diphosphatase
MSWAERIVAADRAGLLAVNGAHSPVLDTWMWYISQPLTWLPVYVLFVVVLRLRWGWRGLLCALPVAGLMVLCSDSGSVVLFKNTVQRLRPCHAADLNGLLHLVNDHCGGRYGFISSHASNHFALATFMAGVLQRRPRWVAVPLLLWAGVVAYSRVYLAAHYPGDVIVGALYGTLIGLLAFWLFLWLNERTRER